jgi:hypothetical protein
MYECTHPHFAKCEIINVYAGGSAMACVKGVSLLGMSEVNNVKVEARRFVACLTTRILAVEFVDRQQVLG